MSLCAYLNLDDAWNPAGVVAGMPHIDARRWGPKLRYISPRKTIEFFAAEVGPQLPQLVITGSGDFHHLTGLHIRRPTRPFTLVSFDNHPDWDTRPPQWACGGWINRALEWPLVQRAAIWGCGNFELAWPGRIFRNRRLLRAGRLAVHGWAERQSPATARRFDCMTRNNWRDRFERFASRLGGSAVYITIDIDCVRKEEAFTNWENGLFTADDVAWAVRLLAAASPLVGGDLCGAYSRPRYARWEQKLAGWWDHPPVETGDVARNEQVLRTVWPALAGI